MIRHVLDMQWVTWTDVQGIIHPHAISRKSWVIAVVDESFDEVEIRIADFLRVSCGWDVHIAGALSA